MKVEARGTFLRFPFIRLFLGRIWIGSASPGVVATLSEMIDYVPMIVLHEMCSRRTRVENEMKGEYEERF